LSRTARRRLESPRFAAGPATITRPLLLTSLLLTACATGGAPSLDQPEAPAVTEAQAPVPARQPTVDDTSSAANAAAPSPVAAYLDDPEAITAGRRMFRAVCTGYCHSTTPGVTKDAPNLFDCDWDHGNEDADLYRVITEGVANTEMLPFDGKIPEETIWQVIAYVRSNSMDCS